MGAVKKSPGHKRSRSTEAVNKNDVHTQVLNTSTKALPGAEEATTASPPHADESVGHTTEGSPKDIPVKISIPFFCSLCLSTSTLEPVVIHEGTVSAAAYGLDEAGIIPSSGEGSGAAHQSSTSTLKQLPTACVACSDCSRRFALKSLITACATVLGNFPRDGVSAADEAQMGPLLSHSFPLDVQQDSTANYLTVELEQNAKLPLQGLCTLQHVDCPVCLEMRSIRIVGHFGTRELNPNELSENENDNVESRTVSESIQPPDQLEDRLYSAVEAFEVAMRETMRHSVRTMEPETARYETHSEKNSFFPFLEDWREATNKRLAREAVEAASSAVAGSGSLRTLASATATGLSAGSARNIPSKSSPQQQGTSKAKPGVTPISTIQDAVILNWFTGNADTNAFSADVFLPLAASPAKQRHLQGFKAPENNHSLLTRKPSLLAGGALLKLATAQPLSAASNINDVSASTHPPALLPTCGACEEASGTVDCLECGFPLCEGCLLSSHSKGRYKTHTVVPIGQANRHKGRKCSDHPDQALELFCRDCKVCVCVRCCFTGAVATTGQIVESASRTRSSTSVSNNNKSHNGHNVVPIAEVIAEISAEVAVSVEKMKLWGARASAISAALKDTIPKIGQREEQLSTHIHAHFNELRAQLLRSEQETLSSVRRFLAVQRDSVDQTTLLFQKAFEESKTLSRTMAAITEETHPTVAVQLQAAVARRVEVATREVESVGVLALMANASLSGQSDILLNTFSSLVTEVGPTSTGPISEPTLLKALLAPLIPNVENLNFEQRALAGNSDATDPFTTAIYNSFSITYPQATNSLMEGLDEEAQKLMLWHHERVVAEQSMLMGLALQKQAEQDNALPAEGPRLSLSEIADVADAQHTSHAPAVPAHYEQFVNQQRPSHQQQAYLHHPQQSYAHTNQYAPQQQPSSYQSHNQSYHQQPQYQFSTAPAHETPVLHAVETSPYNPSTRQTPSRPANRLSGAHQGEVPNQGGLSNAQAHRYQPKEVLVNAQYGSRSFTSASNRIGTKHTAARDDDEDSIGLMVGSKATGRVSGGSGALAQKTTRGSEQSSGRASAQPTAARTTLGGIARIFQMNNSVPLANPASPTTPQQTEALPQQPPLQQSSRRRGTTTSPAATGAAESNRVSPKPSSRSKAGALASGGIQLHL